MRLIQAKARCVEGVRDSGWFVPGRESTVIHDPGGKSISYLFAALQALNPPYQITEKKPFVSHPKTWQQGTYGRKVIPGKKTAVIMVFSAVPELVRELSEIDESFFETDRIEVGRRLDYSRWITFVEISASGRWSDVRDEALQLRSLVGSAEWQKKCAFIDELLDTDRLKGDLADKCRSWLDWLHETVPDLSAEQYDLYQHCLQWVNQAERFNKARRHVQQWLPPTLVVGFQHCSETEGVIDAGGPLETVAALLHKVNKECGQTEKEVLQDSLVAIRERLNVEAPFQDLVEKPELLWEQNRLCLPPMTGDYSLPYLQRQLYLHCFLSLLIYHRKPLLLLDLTGCIVDGGECAELAGWLQQLGRYCQIIVGTDNKTLADAEGWQSVLHIDAEGLAEGGLQKG